MMQAEQLVTNPDFLAYHFDFSTETIEFIKVTPEDLARATWLSRECLESKDSSVKLALSEVLRVLSSSAPQTSQPIHFVFHTAYCASTFLSRCLAVEGRSVGLREPQLLLDAANAKRIQWRSKSTQIDYRHWPALALRLLQKHASPDQTLIFKPVNSVNNIMHELLSASSSSKAVIMYTDARNFLLSTLKKGEEAKQRQRSMFDLLRCDFPHLANLTLSDAIQLSDLKLCLTLWRLQIEQAKQFLDHSLFRERTRSLYAETLIADPLRGLGDANTFFNLGLSLEKIASSDLVSRDAKNLEKPFSVSNRAQRYESIERDYAEDIANGFEWLSKNNPEILLVPQLARAIGRD